MESFADLLFPCITWAGSLVLLVPLTICAIVALRSIGRPAEALLIGGGLVGASVAANLLKLVVARPRPPTVELMTTIPAGYSFPSGHSAQAWAFWIGCAIVSSRLDLPYRPLILAGCVFIAILVGVSRLYLGVHYPSDVIAGALLGLLWLGVWHRLVIGGAVLDDR